MTEPRRATIVVGVDDRPEGQRALRWAIDEAGRTAMDLHVVFVYGWERPMSVYYEAYGDLPPTDEERKLLADAAEQARLVLGSDHVQESLVAGHPARALLSAAEQASLLVVGSRSKSAARAVLLGSVSCAVSAHAHCPVVVLRGDEPAPAAEVVVGVDGSDSSNSALEFAFERAEREGRPVRLVHSWNRRSHVDPELLSETALARHVAKHQEWLDATASTYQAKFPQADVSTSVVEGNAASVLVQEARQAALLVVGSRGRGGFASLMLGSTSQGVLHHAHVSVAVIHAAKGSTDE